MPKTAFLVSNLPLITTEFFPISLGHIIMLLVALSKNSGDIFDSFISLTFHFIPSCIHLH